MKPWQRTTGLVVGGVAVLALAFGLSGGFRRASSEPATAGKAPANAVQAAARPGTKGGPANPPPAVSRPGARPGAPTNALAGIKRPGPPTNALAGIKRPGPPTNALAGMKRALPPTNALAGPRRPVPPPFRGTNVVAAGQRAGKSPPGTNVVAVGGAKPASAWARFTATLRRWQADPSFYPALGVGALGLALAVLLTIRLVSARKRAGAAPGALTSSTAAWLGRRKAPAAVHSCTVLHVGAVTRHLWHFNARTAGCVLNREQASPAGEALPAGLVAKDWRALFQRKLNIAWLPPEQVFLRVAQFPLSDYAETVAMVELQLEKLSPMPVPQIVWSLYVLPQARDGQQTVVVLIVARNVVEEFLGQLEGQGFLADRLEVPALDQLQATAVTEDGTWIYPGMAGGKQTALAAWWYGGTLRNLDLLTLPPTHRAESLREQLLQTAWSGELEGWLTTTPRWHLVADATTAPEWEPALRTGLEEPLEVSTLLPAPQLAAQTANRATRAEAQANLLPVEFATRYRQQFIDRLWMGGLVAVVGLYLAGVAVYLVALEVALMRTRGVEDQVAALSLSYTNAQQIRARFEVLKERQELKYAALDCWKAVAELLPAGVTLESLVFSEGKHLSLTGTAPKEQQQELIRFAGAALKYTKDGQLLFDPTKIEVPSWSGQGNDTVRWSVPFELKRAESQ